MRVAELLPTLQGRVCGVLPGVFSPAECAQLLTPETRAAFVPAHSHYPTFYRNNDRLVRHDPALATHIACRLRPVVPAQLVLTEDGPGEDGTWEFHGLNPRFRYCCYRPQQYFRRHQDGVFHAEADVQSKLTFLLYLNDAEEFTGGHTLFYADAFSPEPTARYAPRRGDVLVFHHKLWHEGELITAGEKYILRSDLLYRRIAPAADSAAADGPATPWATGHAGYVWRLAALGPGRILSGGRDATLRVWHTAQGQCVQTLRGHTQSVLAVAALPGGGGVVTASRDQTLGIWGVNLAGEISHTRSIPAAGATPLSLCALTPGTFAVGDAAGRLRVLTLTGDCQAEMDTDPEWVWAITAVAPNVLATASQDGRIRLWHTVTATEIAPLATAPTGVQCLALSPCGLYLVAGTECGQLLVFQRPNVNSLAFQKTGQWAVHRARLSSLAFTAAHTVATGGEDYQVCRTDIRTGQRVGGYAHTNFVMAVLHTPETGLLSAGYDGVRGAGVDLGARE